MAVGDAVGAVVNAAPLTFQPAAGVECVITAFGNEALANSCNIDDGTNRCEMRIIGGQRNPLNTKIIISNSLYLYMGATAGKTGYTGLQIK